MSVSLEYVKKIKNIIKENLDRYSLVNNNNNNNNGINGNNHQSSEKREFLINDQLLLETILLTIRGETIKYSSYKKKQNSEQELKLENDIKHLEERVKKDLNNISLEEILLLNEKKETLAEIRKTIIEGVMLRSRCRYEDLGEKPAKYFLSLENRNYQDKVIQHLIDEKGEEVNKTMDILEVQKNYYKIYILK